MSDLKLDFRLPTTLPTVLPVLPLRKGVLLPGGVNLFTVGRPKSRAAIEASVDKLIIVAAQREPVDDPTGGDLLEIGVLARVVDIQEHGRGHMAVLVQGLQRVELTGFTNESRFLGGTFSRLPETWPDTAHAQALANAVRENAQRAAVLFGVESRVAAVLKQVRDPALLVDAIASVLDADEEWKREFLSDRAPLRRAEKVIVELARVQGVQEARNTIRDKVEVDTREQQKNFALRQQLKAIQTELGDGDDDDAFAKLKARLAEKKFPEEARNAVDRELKRLERMNAQGPERGVALDWLEWMADLPFGETSGVDTDLTALEEALAKSHYGLADVKRQVVENLAVRKLAGNGRADVLLLVGPPGVGKTSIGQAIADATGRKLVRVALGGVRDEAELRGHRRTYIGARPGRLVEGLRRAGTADPVVLLDEIDKLGTGYQGDPAGALLEILDPEQNHAFTDHYLEVPFDLSKVLFIATANDLSSVPAPLRDRMEVLDISGYTADEKVLIAKDHLLPKLAKNAGVAEDDVVISDEALKDAIAGWTREAGVRQLQRTLGRLFRAAAVKKAKGDAALPLHIESSNLPDYLGRRKIHDEMHEGIARAGIATGLAWTAAGGDVLYVEASTMPGTGQLVLTGQLGDVMKESARAALTYVLSNADALGIPPEAYRGRDVHLHVPAGAVPKDGPSAGVTMFTALASLLSGRAVRPDLAMTGEATLRGRVLPVGGIKSKVLAAHRMGLRTLVLPRRNGADLDEIPAATLAELDIVLVDSMTEVFDRALLPRVQVEMAPQAL